MIGQMKLIRTIVDSDLCYVRQGPSAGPPPPVAEHMPSQAQPAEFEPQYESPSSAAPRNGQKVGLARECLHALRGG